MKFRQLQPQNPLWLRPLLMNDVYVLGYDIESRNPATIDMVIFTHLSEAQILEDRIYFWRGTDSTARIEAFVQRESGFNDTVIWQVCIAWLYAWIWSRQHHLNNIIGSLDTRNELTLYKPSEALLVLQVFHQMSRILALGLAQGGLETAPLRSSCDEFVRINAFVRSCAPDPMRRKFLVPVECSQCHVLIQLPETIYLGWRDGELPNFTCENCRCTIVDIDLTKATCPSCGQITGEMPPALADILNTRQVADFQCAECAAQPTLTFNAKREQAKTSDGSNTATQVTQNPEGCLAMVLTSAFFLACMLCLL